jgi:predicted ATPase
MDRELLERETLSAQLDVLLHQAVSSVGRTVLVSGEAGIGKTALVERFAAAAR